MSLGPAMRSFLSRRVFLGTTAAFILLPDKSKAAFAIFQVANLSGPFAMQQLRVGGGGFICGIDILPDGTRLVRCDTFGAYVFPVGGTKYQQLCTTSSLPTANQIPLSASGVYELRGAPSNSQVLYMFYGQANGAGNPWPFVSTNQGATWTQLYGASWTLVAGNAVSGSLRGYGYKGAVDPINPDDFIWSMENGTFYETLNGTSGATATFTTSPGSLPVGGTNAIGCVAFDPNSGTTSGRTNVCYAAPWGQGVYIRTTPTGSFTLIAGTSGAQVCGLRVAGDGSVYYTTGTTSGSDTLHRITWSAGAGSTPTVTNITPSSLTGLIQGFILDPSSNSHITTYGYTSGIADSTNQGTSWATKNTTLSLTATDAPYLATGAVGGASNINGGHLSAAVSVDPNSPNDIYIAGWQGVYHTTYPIKAAGVAQAFTTNVLGIEQIAANGVLLTPNNSLPILMMQDWGIMQSPGPNTSPSAQGWDTTSQLSACWYADWASSNPAKIFTTMTGPGDTGPDDSVFNTNNGAGSGSSAWPKYGQSLPDKFGSIAAFDNNNAVFSGNSNLYLTANGGTTWTQQVAPAGNASATSGWNGLGGVAPWRCLAADRVNGVFYAFHPTQGLFVYTIATTTWTNPVNASMYTGGGSGGYCYLKSVFGQAGCLSFSFYGGSGGQYTTPNASRRFYYSSNGGTSFTIVGPAGQTSVGSIVEVWAHDWGAPAPGHTFPALYIYGWVYNGTTYVQGINRCINIDANPTNPALWTFTNLTGAYPDGWTDWNKDLAADKLIYGRIALAKAGSSFSIGQFA